MAFRNDDKAAKFRRPTHSARTTNAGMMSENSRQQEQQQQQRDDDDEIPMGIEF